MGTSFLLEDRQIISFCPPSYLPKNVREDFFGVALDNDEAQRFIEEGLTVDCDDLGPLLRVHYRSKKQAVTRFEFATVLVSVLIMNVGVFEPKICVAEYIDKGD